MDLPIHEKDNGANPISINYCIRKLPPYDYTCLILSQYKCVQIYRLMPPYIFRVINHKKLIFGLHVHFLQSIYCIAGKFGGAKVWRIYSFRAFGKKSLENE